MSARLRFGIAACVVVLAIVGLIGFSISGATAYYRTPAEMKAGSYRPNERRTSGPRPAISHPPGEPGAQARERPFDDPRMI